MRKKVIDLDNLTKTDVYSLATALLFVLKDEPKYSATSELFYLLDLRNFTNLIKYYGGTTIKIPTPEEVNSILRIFLLYQYFKIENKDWNEALSLAGYSENESASARTQLVNLVKLLEDRNLLDRSYQSERTN